MSDEKATPIHPIKIATIITGVISILLALGTIGATETNQPYRVQMGLGLGALGGSLLTIVGSIISAFIPDADPNDSHPDPEIQDNTTAGHLTRNEQPPESQETDRDDDYIEFTPKAFTPLNPGSWGVN